MTQKPPKLFTPGPVEVPDELLDAGREIVHHRSGLFREWFAEASLGLRRLFRTKGDVAILAASGSGGMEAAVANTVSPEDPVVVVGSGKYGGRWEELCTAYGARVDRIAVEPGDVVDPREVERRVDQVKPIAVFIVHSETSTGALNDVEAVARAVRRRTAVVVDVISSLGVHPFEMDRWGVALAVGASQKGLGLPPGMAFVAVGPRARSLLDASRSPRYYLDLRKYLAASAKDETPFTAPVTHVAALVHSLRRLNPVREHIARHARLAEATRAGCRALRLEVLPKVPSNAVTVVRVPRSLDAETLVRVLSDEFGIRIAGGQGALRGRVLRLGHLGWLEDEDLIQLFEALERALKQCKYRFERGRGLNAARASLLSGREG